MKPTKRFSPKNFFETYITDDPANQAKILLLMTSMSKEELAKFAVKMSSYAEVSKTEEKAEYEKYSLILHKFCEDLNDFYFAKLMQALTLACHSTNPVSPFIDYFLKKFDVDARRTAEILIQKA
jgi:hypothetical protein